MTENVGTIDRGLRFIGGIILLIEEQKLSGSKGFLMQSLGFYVLLTACMGTCVLYLFMNFSTKG